MQTEAPVKPTAKPDTQNQAPVSGASLFEISAFAKNIWYVHRRQNYMGLEVGSRMTIIKLSSGYIMLISPVAIDEILKAEIESLSEFPSPVKYVVSPNLFHHLHIESCMAAFPDAQLFVAPGLPEKRASGRYPNLDFNYKILAEDDNEWSEDLDLCYFEGYRIFELDGPKDVNEFVFFHRESKTLVVTDIAFHFTRNSSFLVRVFAFFFGGLNKVQPLIQDQWATRDRLSVRKAYDVVMSWPFEKMMMGHGDLLHTDAKSRLQDGYRWLTKNS